VDVSDGLLADQHLSGPLPAGGTERMDGCLDIDRYVSGDGRLEYMVYGYVGCPYPD
jgi:hypothetical protein